MKIKELHQKTNEELQSLLKELREKLRQLKFGLSEKKLKNVREISLTKKTIAQALTLLRSRRAPAAAKASADKSEGQAILNQKHEQK